MLPRRLKNLQRELKKGGRLVPSLRRFFKRQVSLARAGEEIRRALDRREEAFLRLVAQILSSPPSPYFQLLRHAGAGYADIEAQVRRHGVEATLGRLAAEGVYLTSQEFKGKTEVVRGSTSFRIPRNSFENGTAAPGYVTRSSGTTNAPLASDVSLDWLAARAFITAVFFDAHDLFSRVHALYDSILPAAGGMNNLLIYNQLGVIPERWFARVTSGERSSSGYLTTYFIVVMGKLYGPGFPAPEFLQLRDIRRIVDWMAEKRRAGKSACLTTAASNAARIARVAWDLGVSLEGCRFVCSGEPFTEAKRGIIERAGARGTVRCTIGNSVNLGFGCAHPAAADEVHVGEDMLALISHRRFDRTADAPVEPLLCTTLHPSASSIFFNVESGDYGLLGRRDCGCPLEKAGLTLHLQRVRSFEKFTSEGMNYHCMDLYELVEKTLPREFGGGPGDYQVREEEDENGQTKISLVIDPAVGNLDEQRLLLRLRESCGSPNGRVRFWRDAGTLRVKREAPHASARGKILPLHIARR